MKSLDKIVSVFTQVQKDLGIFISKADKEIQMKTDNIYDLEDARAKVTAEKTRAEKVQGQLSKLVGDPE